MKWDEFYKSKIRPLNEEYSVDQGDQGLQRLWNSYLRAQGGNPQQTFAQFIKDFEAASENFLYPGGAEYSTVELTGLDPQWVQRWTDEQIM